MATLATQTAPSSLTPPQSRAALTTECLTLLLAGRPFPEGIAPPTYVAPVAARAGIAWILDGPAGGGVQ